MMQELHHEVTDTSPKDILGKIVVHKIQEASDRFVVDIHDMGADLGSVR